MANLHITELSNLPSVDGIGVEALAADCITACQVVAIGASVNISAPFFNPAETRSPIDSSVPPTRWVMLTAGANCAVTFSSVAANTAANANSTPILINQPPTFVQVPTGWQVSVLNLTP